MTTDTTTTPTASDALRVAAERSGFTIEGVPDDLTWDQVGSFARRVEHESLRSRSPELAALLDVGDLHGAASLFLAELEERHPWLSARNVGERP